MAFPVGAHVFAQALDVQGTQATSLHVVYIAQRVTGGPPTRTRTCQTHPGSSSAQPCLDWIGSFWTRAAHEARQLGAAACWTLCSYRARLLMPHSSAMESSIKVLHRSCDGPSSSGSLLEVGQLAEQVDHLKQQLAAVEQVRVVMNTIQSVSFCLSGSCEHTCHDVSPVRPRPKPQQSARKPGR